jgi:hypothetical protein
MPAKSPVLRHAVAVAGAEARTGNPERLAVARSALAAERIATYIERVVAEAPPLTSEQRLRLVGLLTGSAA